MKPRILSTARLSLPLAAALAALAAPVQAASPYTWTKNSAATQTWTTTGNWDANGVDSGPGINTDVLNFFADTTTALAAGNNLITTSVPTLTMNVLTLKGLGATATGATNVTIGTNATTWTLDGTTPTVNLNGLVGTQGLNYTVAVNLALAQAITLFTGNGTASFNFSGNITGSGKGIAKSGTSTLTLSGTNSYNGGTTVSGGILNTTAAAALPGYNSTGQVVFSGGTVGAQVGGSGWTTTQVDTLLSNATKTSGALGIDTTNGDLTQWTAFTTTNLGSALGLNKLGAGTLTLDQTNTYTGLTTVTGGTLQIGSGSTTGTLNTSSAIINNGTLTFNRSNAVVQGTDFSGAAISGTGALIQAGSNNLTLNAANTYSGSTTVSTGTLTLSNPLALQNSALNTTGAGTITLSGVTIPTFGGLSNSGTTRDLSTVISSGYSGITNLTLNTLSGATPNYSGVISGAISLTKTGAGTQTLQGANTYSGVTYLNTPGTLANQSAGALNLSGNGSILNSAITLNGGSLTLTNTVAETGSGRINDSYVITSNGGTFTYANTATTSIVYAETVGSVALTSGQLNLVESTNQNATGNTQTLMLSGLTHSGSTNTSTVTFSATTTGPNTTTNMFVVTGGSTSGGSIIGPWATVGTTATAQTDYAIYNSSAQVVPAGIGATAQPGWSTDNTTGTGTLNNTLANAAGSAFNGRLTATRNINSVRNNSSTANLTSISSNVITVTGSSFQNGDVVQIGGTAPAPLVAGTVYYVVGASGATFQLAATSGGSPITITGGVSGNIGGGITLSSGNNLGTYGILNGASSTLAIGASGTGALTLPTNTSGNLYVTAGSGAVTINAPITDNGSGVLTLVLSGKTGSGIWLGGANNYSGGTVINSGEIYVSHPSSANETAFGAAGTTITFNGSATYQAQVGGSGTLSTNARPIVLNNGAIMSLFTSGGNDSKITFNGAISGTGGIAFQQTGNLTQTFILNNANNTFTGSVTIGKDGGGNTLNLKFASLADSAGAGNIQFMQAANGVFQYTGSTNLTLNNRQIALFGAANNGPATLDSSGTGTFTVNTDLLVSMASGINRTLQLQGSNTGNNLFAGKIADGSTSVISLTKTGAGTWILGGANTYTGGTTLTTGMLQFAKLVAMPTAGVVAAATGTTLAVNVGGTGEWTTGTSGNGTIGGLLGGLGGQAGGTVTYAGTATVGFDTSNASITQTYAGNIANMGTTLGIRKLGINTLQLTGTNTYTGTTTVSDGTLEVLSGTGNITQSLGPLTLAGPDVTLTSTKSGAGTLSTTFGSLTARAAGDTGNIVSTTGTNGTDNSIKLTQAAGFIDKGVYFNGSDFAAMAGLNTYVRALAYGSDTNASAVGTIASGKYTKLTINPACKYIHLL